MGEGVDQADDRTWIGWRAMSMLSDVLVTALGLTAVIGVLSGLAVVATEPRRQRIETLTDRWRKLSDEVPR